MFIRLQHENKMLLLKQEGSENERIAELQEQLEQKHRTVNELETEKRWWVKLHLKMQQKVISGVSGWPVPCICSVALCRNLFFHQCNHKWRIMKQGRSFKCGVVRCGRSVCTIPWGKCCLQDTLLSCEWFLVDQEWMWTLFLEFQTLRPWIFYQWMLKQFTRIWKFLVVRFSQNLKWLQQFHYKMFNKAPCLFQQKFKSN